MNEIQIFNSDEFERIKSIEDTTKNSYFGFIYFLEYGKIAQLKSKSRGLTKID